MSTLDFCPERCFGGTGHCVLEEGVHAQYQQDSDVASRAANNTRIRPISDGGASEDDVRGVACLAPPTHRRATEQVLNAES